MRFKGMVCKGRGSCRYILGILLMVHSQPRPLTSAKGKDLNLPQRKAKAWGPAAYQNEAQHPPDTHTPDTGKRLIHKSEAILIFKK